MPRTTPKNHRALIDERTVLLVGTRAAPVPMGTILQTRRSSTLSRTRCHIGSPGGVFTLNTIPPPFASYRRRILGSRSAPRILRDLPPVFCRMEGYPYAPVPLRDTGMEALGSHLDEGFTMADAAHEHFRLVATVAHWDMAIFGPRGAAFGGFFPRAANGFLFEVVHQGRRREVDLHEYLANAAHALEDTLRTYGLDRNKHAWTLIQGVVELERVLHFLAHNGVQVFMHQNLITSMRRAGRQFWDNLPPTEADARLLAVRESADFPSSPQARMGNFWESIYVLPANWIDPRAQDVTQPGLSNSRDRVIRFDGFLEYLDHLAKHGISNPDGVLSREFENGREHPDPSAVIPDSSAEIEDREYHVSPPPSPSPSPLPSPPPPLPSSPSSDVEMLDAEEPVLTKPDPPIRPFIRVPPRPAFHKRPRVEVVTDSEDERPHARRRVHRRPSPSPPRGGGVFFAPEEFSARSCRAPLPVRSVCRRKGPQRAPSLSSRYSSQVPRGVRSRGSRRAPRHRRQEPADPPADPAPLLEPIPGGVARYFRGEQHRPLGDVAGRICSNGTGQVDRNAPRPKKGRYTCDVCAKLHSSCASWAGFHDQYKARDITDYSFEYWEHVGQGNFIPLHPDYRLWDLNTVACEQGYRSFCYDLQPLLNMERARRRVPHSQRKKRGVRAEGVMVEAREEDAPVEPPAGTPVKDPVADADITMGEAPPIEISSESADEDREAVISVGDYDLDEPDEECMGFSLGDYDLDKEPAPPPAAPSQQAGPSRPRPSSVASPHPSTPECVPEPGFLDRLFNHSEQGVDVLHRDVNSVLEWYEVQGSGSEDPVVRLETHRYMMRVMEQVEIDLARRVEPESQGKGKGKERAMD
ncbi:hypothetical protein C8R44DRAFT_754893 [Mycena epipterygia]|nr:hypothetical protein C8R44DRAFT_754893 [Mycena epipterygia]